MKGKDGFKRAAVFVTALVIGTLMARGLPHHAAAPAAPPPSSGSGRGSGLGVGVYDVLIVLIIGGLVARYIHLRHKRNLRELAIERAKLDQFYNVRRGDLGDLWRCSDCHALILLVDIDDHQTDSPCAERVARLAELDAADDAPAAERGYTAEQVTGAATVPPEHSVTAGDYDTFRAVE